MRFDGVLVVDKPPGMTSRRVVTSISRLVGVPKAGHAGTLDPLATGVLVLALGRATLLTRYISGGRKEYEVTARLGLETDTFDIEGKMVKEADTSHVSEESILGALEKIAARTTQRPPSHSAVKHLGKPLYHYARKGIKLVPPERPLDVSSLELDGLERSGDRMEARLSIECGPGTYVRSIVHDLGVALGTGACVSELRRTRSGYFDLSDAERLEALVTGGRPFVLSKTQSMEEATSFMPSVVVDTEGAVATSRGVPLQSSSITNRAGVAQGEEPFRVLDPANLLIAIYGPARKSDGEDIAGRALRVIRPEGEAGDHEVA